ncbi:hypothetical protein BKA69DRAFT_289919 [Paraphysoderma sedebokerense]|nr:hypothetical protein BKA69DRAFT_289919 [Paraphysoderma sedebokerense]
MWWEDVPLAVAACILYVAGIPLYFFMQLFAFYQRKRNSPFWQKARDLSHRIMRMDHSFKPESQYFTFFQILQKLAMVAISMFFTKYTTFQVALMILVLMATSGIYTVFQPYSVRQLNFIEILSVLVVAFVTAVFPYIKDTLRPLEKIGEFMRSQKSSLGVHDMTER